MLNLRRLKFALSASVALALAAAPALAQQVNGVVNHGNTPSNTLGSNGNYSLDFSFGNIVGPKAGGAWPSYSANSVWGDASLPLGADSTGATDSTAAIQAVINSGTGNLFLPAGKYLLCGLKMPSTHGFHMWGQGTATNLAPTGACLTTAGTSMISWGTTLPSGNSGQSITDMVIDTSGSGATGSKSDAILVPGGVSDVALDNLYFVNVPIGSPGIASAISIAGTSGNLARGIRIRNLKGYGPGHTWSTGDLITINYADDVSIENAVFSGGTTASWGLYASNSSNIQLAHSHLYNVTANDLFLYNSSNVLLDDDILDFANNAIASLNNTTHVSFKGGYIQGIKPTQVGIDISGSTRTTITGTKFSTVNTTAPLALSAVRDYGPTTSYTSILGADPGGLSYYSGTVFDVTGANSYVSATPGVAMPGASNMATSGTGGNYVCLNKTTGVFYRKASCP